MRTAFVATASSPAVTLAVGVEPTASGTLGKLFRVHWARMLLTYGLLAAENLLRLAQPYCLGLAIDDLLHGSARGLAALIIQHAVATVAAAARRMYDTRAYTAIYTDLAVSIVGAQRQNAIEVSRVAARSALSRELVDFFERDVAVALTMAFSIVGALAMLAAYDIRLALLCLAASAPSALLNRRFGRRAMGINRRLHDEFEREVGVIERGQADEVRAHFDRVAARRVELSDAQALNAAALESVVLGLLALALVLTCAGSFGDLGRIVAVIRYVLMFAMGLDGIPALVEQAGRLRDIGRRLRIEMPEDLGGTVYES